jgi:hypothetical protein
VVTGDLRDASAVADTAQGGVIFHLGALIAIPYSYLHPREVVETNVLGTLNVLQAARQHGVERVVHTSTSEVYGTAQYVPIDEKHPLVGQSPYSASKIGADQLAESFHRSYELAVATVRPFNTYGPRQSARAVIPSILIQAITADRIFLGATHPTRDLVFVKDTARGFVELAGCDAAVGQVVNLGSGREVRCGADRADRRPGRASGRDRVRRHSPPPGAERGGPARRRQPAGAGARGLGAPGEPRRGAACHHRLDLRPRRPLPAARVRGLASASIDR